MQDIPVKVDGVSVMPAVEWNQIPAELETAITDTGQTLSGGILDQISKAMSTYAAGGDFFTDSGVADAYVLTAVGSKKAPTAYFNGMSVRFLVGNVNTGGAATVNVATLGVKNIKLADGTTDPEAGQLPASAESTLTYDGTNFRITNVSAPIILRALGNTTQPGEIRLLEDTDNGVNYIGFKAPALVTANTVFELPDGDGAAGEFLKTNGSKVLSFAAQTGSWTKIASATASASATIEFTGLAAGRVYMVYIDNLAPATNIADLLFRTSTDGGSTFDIGASDYAWSIVFRSPGSLSSAIDGSDTKISLTPPPSVDGLGNAANETYSGTVKIYSPSSSAFTRINSEFIYANHNGQDQIMVGHGGGFRLSAADVNAIQFLMDTGTIATGELGLYELIA